MRFSGKSLQHQAVSRKHGLGAGASGKGCSVHVNALCRGVSSIAPRHHLKRRAWIQRATWQ